MFYLSYVVGWHSGTGLWSSIGLDALGRLGSVVEMGVLRDELRTGRIRVGC